MLDDLQPSPPARTDPARGASTGGRRGRRARRPAVLVVAFLASVAVLAGCGTSGRTLRDPAPGATAPPRKGAVTTSTAVLDTLAPSGLSISSSAWVPGGEIPASHTCEGQDVSPPITISGAPEGTVELLLVVTDQDAGGLLQWVVAGITPESPSFTPGEIPQGAVEVPGSSGAAGWTGPCPTAGTTNTYDFTVYALPEPSGLGASSTPDAVDAASSLAIATAAMTGTYTGS